VASVVAKLFCLQYGLQHRWRLNTAAARLYICAAGRRGERTSGGDGVRGLFMVSVNWWIADLTCGVNRQTGRQHEQSGWTCGRVWFKNEPAAQKRRRRIANVIRKNLSATQHQNNISAATPRQISPGAGMAAYNSCISGKIWRMSEKPIICRQRQPLAQPASLVKRCTEERRKYGGGNGAARGERQSGE